MPEAPELLTLQDADGNVTRVPVDQAGTLLANGYHVQSNQEAAARLAGQAKEELYGGVGGTVASTFLGGLRGATLGASDVGLSALGMGDELAGYRDVNPIASTVGEVGGGLAAAFATPGSLLGRSPTALAARAGARIAELGEGGSLLARTGARALAGAAEGGLQGAGSYISDVALGDRELSADGFMGAMGHGALWGGVAAGSLSVAADGLVAARRLFPRSEVTREAVEVAEQAAKREVSTAVADSDALADAARNRLREIRAEHAAQDLATKKTLDEIAVRKAQEVADASVRAAEAKAATAEARLEKAKSAGTRRARKALQAEETVVPATEGAVADGATDLERQLAATKSALDSGKTLADLSQRPVKATHIEDALNAHVAQFDPEAAKLVQGIDRLEQSKTALDSWLDTYKGGAVSKFERGQAARDWAEGIRPKDAGYYTKLPMDSQTPGMLEGSAGMARGRQSVWRGSEEERALADARTMSKLSPEEQLAADQAVEDAARRRSRKIADEVTSPADIETKVDAALKSRTPNIDEDIGKTAEAISRHEAAMADVTEALGPLAPPSAVARAQGFREAQQGAEAATGEATQRAVADASKAADAIRLRGPEVVSPASKGRGLLDMAKDAGGVLEGLRMMGIDVPDPKNIPVVGPLLSMYLKARVLGKVFGRFGGKVAETAETTIAGKAAATKERMYQALDKLTEHGAKVAATASPRIGTPAAALGHVLFDDGEPSRKAYSSQAKGDDIAALYAKRADEVTRAMEPGAVEKAVSARVRTSDPRVLDAIVEAQQRKLDFLHDKMPKPNEAAIPTQTRMPWVPSRAQINQWSRYVEAAENPVGVIEAAANDGHLTVEGVETLRTVYPRLYEEAQKRIIQRAMDATEPLPYARRVQLSIMFDMPMDGSQTPDGAAFLQQGYKTPTHPQQPPQPQFGAPTVRADVRMSGRVDPTSKEL